MSLLDTLQKAKVEDIFKGLQDMAPEDRKKVQEALKIIETESFKKVARSYGCSGGDGDWGEFSMRVTLGADGTGTVKETSVMFRDSPEETETWYGSYTVKGDFISFSATELEKTSSGAAGVHTAPKKPEKKEFFFRTTEDQNLLQVSPKGEEFEMPFADGKKKILTWRLKADFIKPDLP